MKRLLSTACVLMILISGMAFAESRLDISSLSLEELVKHRSEVENEIEERVSSATATLYPGLYTAGVDIAAGAYILTGLMDKGPGGYTPQVLYAESLDAVDSWEYIDYRYLKNDGSIWRITLQDGMVLEVRSGNVAIQKAPPMLFAPQGD